VATVGYYWIQFLDVNDKVFDVSIQLLDALMYEPPIIVRCLNSNFSKHSSYYVKNLYSKIAKKITFI
jgi:hypothetical protein